MDLFLFEKLAVTRLRQRCTVDETGIAYFRIDGRSAVALPAEEWNALGDRFRAAIRPSARLVRWSVWLAIPVAIAILVLVHALPPLEAAIDRVDAAIPGLIPLLLGSWLPLTAMVIHMLAVQREIDRTHFLLARRPRQSAPVPPPRRALNFAELAAIVLIGPHILIQIYGTLVPDAFRNTPWTGAHLDWSGWAGLALFVVLIALRLRDVVRRAQPADSVRPPAAAPRAAGNRLRAEAFGRKQG